MTAHVHDPSADGDRRPHGPTASGGAPMASARPRWLLPTLAVGIIAAALVVAGVLPFSTVIYAGLFGGMLLMHAGGHGGHGGHGGGHGGHGGGHEGHGGGTAGAGDLSQPSDDPNGSETHDHDQRNAHSCH